MGSKKKTWQPKRRNDVVRAHIEEEGAGAGFHEIDMETAYARGWRRRRKHVRSLLDEYFDGDYDDDYDYDDEE